MHFLDKMRRNVKLVLAFASLWCGGCVYYVSTPGNDRKVREKLKCKYCCLLASMTDAYVAREKLGFMPLNKTA